MKQNQNSHKFLLLVPYTYPDYSGGGRNAFNFGRFLVKRNIPVKLITFNRNLKYKKQEDKEGLIIKRITYFNKNPFIKAISLIFWIIPVYVNIILKSEIIYIFGKYLIAWQFVVLFSKLCRKKVIFRSMMFGEDDIGTITTRNRYILNNLNEFLLRQIDCYYSIHPGFSFEYYKAFRRDDKIIEMPQGVDQDIFQPVSEKEKKTIRKKLGLPESDFIMVTTAFLIDRKGFDEIFYHLSNLKIPYKYLIIGEYNFDKDHFLAGLQEDSSRLKEKGEDLLGSKLRFIGPKENINEYLQVSDICLFNSKAEGLPNSMLEAMACGIPVVSNPIAGLEGYLLFNKKNSLIFRSANELNFQIKELYNKPEMRKFLGTNANATIMRMGTFDIVLHEICNKLKIEQ